MSQDLSNALAQLIKQKVELSQDWEKKKKSLSDLDNMNLIHADLSIKQSEIQILISQNLYEYTKKAQKNAIKLTYISIIFQRNIKKKLSF